MASPSYYGFPEPMIEGSIAQIMQPDDPRRFPSGLGVADAGTGEKGFWGKLLDEIFSMETVKDLGAGLGATQGAIAAAMEGGMFDDAITNIPRRSLGYEHIPQPGIEAQLLQGLQLIQSPMSRLQMFL